MSTQIRISAVVPTYNRCSSICRAIDSILAQEFPPSEIIVVDDGSTDNTREVLESYADTVRCIYQRNAGASAARNRGVSEASAEWIAFLDSDDYWLPGHLNRIADAIQATAGRAAIYFANIHIDTTTAPTDHWQACGFHLNEDFEFRADAGEWVLLPVHPMILPASVVRRAAYLDVGGLSEALQTREDTLFFYKLGLLYPACAVSGCGTIVKDDGNVRLTQTHTSSSLVYRDATIFMYQNLITSLPAINRRRRQFLIDALAAAYYSKGRLFVIQGRYWNAVRTFCLSLISSPAFFIRELSGSVRRRLIEPIFASNT